MSLIFNVIRKFVFYRCACVSSKTVQNACKTVCFGSSSSQSCGLTLTILQSYIDYLRLLNTQNSMPEGTERHLEAYFSSPETRFSCLGECAGKCQRQCQYDIIIAMPEDRLVQQKKCVNDLVGSRQERLHIIYIVRTDVSLSHSSKSKGSSSSSSNPNIGTSLNWSSARRSFFVGRPVPLCRSMNPEMRDISSSSYCFASVTFS